MKIYVVLGFIVACIVCELNGACTGRNDCSSVKDSAEPPKKIEHVFEGESCDIEKKHKFTVQIPKVIPTKKACDEVGYEVEIPSVKDDSIKRYRYDVRIDQSVTDKPSSEKPCDYVFDVESPPKTDERIIRYRYDSKIEIPSQPSCDKKKVEGLHAQVDKIVSPRKECNCPHKENKSSACNCGATYKLPVNYNSRYDSNSLLNNIYTDMSDLFIENEREDSLNHLKREKREALKNSIKIKRIRKTKKSRKPKKSLKKKRIRSRELSKLNRIPGMQVRRKRIPGGTAPCAYTFKSCDVNNPNVKGRSCPLCYQCKCEPTNMDKQAPIKIGVPYQVAPMHRERNNESHERHEEPKEKNDKGRQQFQNAPPSYVGLPPDMYKKYIGQILSKYPEYMHNKMPDYREQQQDLMKFVGELAQSRIQQEHVRPFARSQKTEDVKYKLIDDAVNLYELYENSQAKRNQGVQAAPTAKNPKSVVPKANNKRGTILEVIELDSDELQSFEHLLEKDFA